VKLKIAVVLIGTLVFALALASTERPPEGVDPILAVGHGAFIGPDGKRIVPTSAFILRAQEHQLNALNKLTRVNQEKVTSRAIEETRALVYGLVEDKTLANALMIDWLIEKLSPTYAIHLTATNNALRLFYVTSIQTNPVRLEGGRWSKGLPIELAKKLEDKGLQVLSLTNGEAQKFGHYGLVVEG
jgi:hypothetical protein